MKKFGKAILKLLVFFVVVIILYLGGVMLYGTLTDYNPKLIEKLNVKGKNLDTVINKNYLTLLTWNIGYAGLGKEMDFFYDGGKKVRPSLEQCKKYLKGICSFVKSADTLDFMLLQEIDVNSRRSYFTNQIDSINKAIPSFDYIFAKNYDVRFVPVPYTEPMGKVDAGLITFSKYKALEATRFAFTANYSWPTRLFMLDRCFIFTKYHLQNNKYLIVINTHNEAFDDGSIRKAQMQVLKDKILEEYSKGNYVIVGGDWNQNPVGFDMNTILKDNKRIVEPPIEKDFLPLGWTWAFDPLCGTDRENIKNFVRGENKTTIIDFFALSPNIKLKLVKGIDLGFEYSDHQPVIMKIELL